MSQHGRGQKVPKPFNRNYGGINPHEVGEVGRPRIVGELCDQECPNCGANKLFHVEVDIAVGQGETSEPGPSSFIGQLLGSKEGKIKGSYLGCACCPWASQMAMVR